jgi:hypothetical protein
MPYIGLDIYSLWQTSTNYWYYPELCRYQLILQQNELFIGLEFQNFEWFHITLSFAPISMCASYLGTGY